MKRVKIEITHTETITLDVEVPKSCLHSEIFEKISDDPALYLEKHLDDIQKSSSKFDIASIVIK